MLPKSRDDVEVRFIYRGIPMGAMDTLKKCNLAGEQLLAVPVWGASQQPAISCPAWFADDLFEVMKDRQEEVQGLALALALISWTQAHALKHGESLENAAGHAQQSEFASSGAKKQTTEAILYGNCGLYWTIAWTTDAMSLGFQIGVLSMSMELLGRPLPRTVPRRAAVVPAHALASQKQPPALALGELPGMKPGTCKMCVEAVLKSSGFTLGLHAAAGQAGHHCRSHIRARAAKGAGKGQVLREMLDLGLPETSGEVPLPETAVEVLACASESGLSAGERVREDPNLNWQQDLEADLRQLFPKHAFGPKESSPSWTWAMPTSLLRKSVSAHTFRAIIWAAEQALGSGSHHHAEEAIISIFASSLEGEAIAVVFDPWRDELFTAVRQHGADLNGVPLSGRAGSDEQLRDVFVGTEASQDPRQSWPNLRGLYFAGPPRTAGVRIFPSAALGLAWVASGRLGAFFSAAPDAAEVAAGRLLVSESGGVVESMDSNSPGASIISARSQKLLLGLLPMLSEANANGMEAG
ncbi:suhB [Symbiodinium pilosum]|uniref:SuhB protein n=1 Tax=Symbiodinium pilosum TaxID=2952 RepID=A0A812MR12_SYMPI|nr:suhB [Symbiodinium pilosum]